eukprot:CAMPEP_0203907482 /NCGR_PEP_ID=MMETSP0359-20131031/48981_1 /ASSEMBLY_ACC=CAM_ASM_000338 /TAXON_ID=268821 /ORGANISM="Scrippsiella Hangoei, Strain SHTV-5" /LENGTH=379 /DNA_ID=CAMNT_0050832303 /DNA_START=124 /DNA_END=1263 /DNA_ORIENTATION=-
MGCHDVAKSVTDLMDVCSRRQVPCLATVLSWLGLRWCLRSCSVSAAWREAGSDLEVWKDLRLRLGAKRKRALASDRGLLAEERLGTWDAEALFQVGKRLRAVALESNEDLGCLPVRHDELGKTCHSTTFSPLDSRRPSEIEVFEYQFGGKQFWFLQHNTGAYGWMELIPDDALGLKVWPPCPVLCQYFSGPDAPSLRGRRCLELGAGVGALGVALATMGAQVTVTEASDLCVRFAKANAKLNGVEEACLVEWLEFGEEDAARYLAAGAEPFDVVLGADVIYVDAAAKPLFESISALLAPGGCAYLGVVERHRHVVLALQQAAAHAGFRWEAPRMIGRELMERYPDQASAARLESVGGLAERVELYKFFRRGEFHLDTMD